MKGPYTLLSDDGIDAAQAIVSRWPYKFIADKIDRPGQFHSPTPRPMPQRSNLKGETELPAIAAELGVSRQRVYQIEGGALDKLRAHFKDPRS